MSARVDFYILAANDDQAGWRFACRLIEKAYRQKQRMYVHCDDQLSAHRFDELLWTFNDISFVPHQLAGETSKYPAPITIGYGESIATASTGLLLNLASEFPSSHPRFKRIMEIVHGDEPTRLAARERFKHYRAAGCEMVSHQMDKY
jgi:DNA polymerase-3 subunit chi